MVRPNLGRSVGKDVVRPPVGSGRLTQGRRVSRFLVPPESPENSLRTFSGFRLSTRPLVTPVRTPSLSPHSRVTQKPLIDSRGTFTSELPLPPNLSVGWGGAPETDPLNVMTSVCLIEGEELTNPPVTTCVRFLLRPLLVTTNPVEESDWESPPATRKPLTPRLLRVAQKHTLGLSKTLVTCSII